MCFDTIDVSWAAANGRATNGKSPASSTFVKGNGFQ